MNRRNVLIGIGALVGGGGAALGSGAFSQAEADRTVDIDVVGDGAAVVNISVVESDALSDGGEDQIALDIDDVYQDAEVLIEPALEFDNTSDDTDYEVELDSGGLITTFTDPSAENEVGDYTEKDGPFQVDSGSQGSDEEVVGIVVDTGDQDESEADDLTITITEV